MKDVFAAVTALLTRAASQRAQLVMQAQATPAREDYRANAGGWN